MADKEEWSVKGLIDRAMAKEESFSVMLAKEAEGLDKLSPGKRYFQEMRIRNSAEKELNSWLKEVCKEIRNCLGEFASDFHERKLLSSDVTGMDMVLNWAFLVPRCFTESFRARICQANEGHSKNGLAFRLSGPWPPYSFCPFLELE